MSEVEAPSPLGQSRRTGRRPGAPTLAERRRKKVAETLERFRDRLPEVLADAAEAAVSPNTSPAVKVQLIGAIEKLTALIPGAAGSPASDDVTTWPQYLRMVAQLQKDFPNQASWDRQRGRLELERDSSRRLNAPLVKQAREKEAENIVLRTAVHRLTGRPPADVIRELKIPEFDPRKVALMHTDGSDYQPESSALPDRVSSEYEPATPPNPGDATATLGSADEILAMLAGTASKTTDEER